MGKGIALRMRAQCVDENHASQRRYRMRSVITSNSVSKRDKGVSVGPYLGLETIRASTAVSGRGLSPHALQIATYLGQRKDKKKLEN